MAKNTDGNLRAPTHRGLCRRPRGESVLGLGMGIDAEGRARASWMTTAPVGVKST